MRDALIIHKDKESAQSMAKLLAKRGMRSLLVYEITSLDKSIAKYPDFTPSLIVIDIDLVEDAWLIAYRRTSRLFPDASFLFTSDSANPQMVLRAKAHGAKYFMRAPFTEDALKHALKRMAYHSQQDKTSWKERLPNVRVPVRVKITFPYVFLAMLIMLGAAYIVSWVARTTVEERFINQLLNTGKLAAEWMVQEEDQMLTTLRLLLNTEGVAEAVSANDAERLREIILPIAVNTGEEGIGVLNGVGENVLTILHFTEGEEEIFNYFRGGADFLGGAFISKIYALQADEQGDKYAGLIFHDTLPYFYVGGPVFSSDGNPVGVILVGRSVENITKNMASDTLAQITLFDHQGNLYSSTLFPDLAEGPVVPMELFQETETNPDDQTLMRSLEQDENFYREIVGRWQARGSEPLGLIGVALPETILIRSNSAVNTQIFILFFLAIGLVTITGIVISNQITKPLLEVVDASEQIFKGNYDVQVKADGNDEVAVLAHSFNRMVSGLQEGAVYRDLLGRTISPEVRDQLRSAVKAGDFNLEGRDAMATVLIADVADFTTLSEQEDPATIFNWLNELFSELVPIVNGYSGVVNEFSGDALFAFFGILPQQLHMAESAYLACKASVEMLKAINRVNRVRDHRGDPLLRMGIGINSGPVTAGGLGAEDRLHYTIIGDTVNTTQRIESLAHQLPESAIMISRQTAIAIWDQRDQFNLVPFGEHTLKGKANKQVVYRLLPPDQTNGILEPSSQKVTY